jgi:hypothetical protein
LQLQPELHSSFMLLIDGAANQRVKPCRTLRRLLLAIRTHDTSLPRQ